MRLRMLIRESKFESLRRRKCARFFWLRDLCGTFYPAGTLQSIARAISRRSMAEQLIARRWSALLEGVHGTVLATRSARTGSNRPVSRDRTAAQGTVVRRAAAPAHVRAFRRNLDRR